ncbi:Late embryogenesis abundant (LEA) hydroxyproline-rich glycoprotein family [Striga hermonthica]|uniref:Late embryogenesis abundant (LEA) hydroxyproline-rich glycoprotein family n=1 Tax=Striga hermonthica TaxID=68872 RepID=A0A9N7R5Y4_STRHE|nr:Late embryogenesis abundant (LEA) hydroxyproline-rich glycoprotein family [Striga hermonthica]
MSQIHEKSPKHCANKQSLNLPKLNKKLYLYLSTLLLSILSLIFLVWLVLHPTKPKFSVERALVNQLNLSGPSSSLLNSSIQLTIQSHNPNKKVGIFYDQLSVCASYKGEQITPETLVSPFYQEHEESNVISVFLDGAQQPVGPSFAYEVRHDQGIGRLVFEFKVVGKLRWKIGTWVSGRYRIFVRCSTVLPFGSMPSPPLSSRQSSECSTEL